MDEREGMTRRIGRERLVGVIRADGPGGAIALARAAIQGGISLVEITMTTPGALVAIDALAAEGHAVGAGTVRTVGDARDALSAGARFLVSPHLDGAIVGVGREAGVCCSAGAVTPTEVAQALSLGVDLIKIFPASSFGGPAHLRALRDPFPEARFMPTGGVSPDNLVDYLEAGAWAVGVSSALFPRPGEPPDLDGVTRKSSLLVERLRLGLISR